MWCGVVWCGVGWCGVVCGVVWCGVVVWCVWWWYTSDAAAEVRAAKLSAQPRVIT